MTKRRFVTRPLTGYTIGPGGLQISRRETTVWYVLDRAYCHRIVRRFAGRHAGWRAYVAAETLEAGDDSPALPLKMQGALEHVSCTCPAQIVGSQWHDLRCALRDPNHVQRRSTSPFCSGCGCEHDDTTPGCRRCYDRHRYRRLAAIDVNWRRRPR